MTSRDVVLNMFREWLAEKVPVLQGVGVEIEVGENLESAGSDPILWADFFAGSRGARLALWRNDEMEFDRDDLDIDEIFTPRHFRSREGFSDAINVLLSWISVDSTRFSPSDVV